LGPGTCLVAHPDPDWTGLYFVGAIVYGYGQTPDLESEAVQLEANVLRWQPGVALEFPHPVHWRQGIKCETECLGFYFKHQGIRVGEEQFLATHLRHFLTRLTDAASAPNFSFAEDRDRQSIRLLATCSGLAEEFVWEAWTDEAHEAFCECASRQIAEVFGDIEPPAKVAPAEYERRARAGGLFWIACAESLQTACHQPVEYFPNPIW
jgi:hypothetical protein